MANKINDVLAEDFQLVVDNYIDRNRNILDTMSKYQMASSRLSRAITKASTQCGCISISSGKTGDNDASITGSLCKNCHAVIEKEMGDVLFYLAAISNALDLSMYDIMLSEKKTLAMLGNFSLK